MEQLKAVEDVMKKFLSSNDLVNAQLLVQYLDRQYGLNRDNIVDSMLLTEAIDLHTKLQSRYQEVEDGLALLCNRTRCPPIDITQKREAPKKSGCCW